MEEDKADEREELNSDRLARCDQMVPDVARCDQLLPGVTSPTTNDATFDDVLKVLYITGLPAYSDTGYCDIPLTVTLFGRPNMRASTVIGMHALSL